MKIQITMDSAGGVTDEINLRGVKVKWICTNHRHFLFHRNISLAIKYMVYNSSVRAVLLYVWRSDLQVTDVR